MHQVVIIGNGIAGITAARHIRKRSNCGITVISEESEFFWARTALMYIYMGHMQFEHTKPYEDHFWKKNNINLLFGRATSVDTRAKSVAIDTRETLPYDTLILATGSQPNYFGWPGQELKGVTGMVSLQDLERIEQYTKDISRGVIVGGGLIGIELAEMLRSKNITVSFLVREPYFWSGVLPEQEGNMISRHIVKHHVDLRLNSELATIAGNDKGRVCSIKTAKAEVIDCDFVGITTGVHGNIALCKDSEIKTNRGILVNEYLETSVPNVYAIGDCAELAEAQPGRRTIEQVWYVGRMMGEVVAQTITGEKKAYRPGPWFNSAKFFDIEYQTYGNVTPECPEDEHDFFWKADQKDIALHCRFKKKNLQFAGINTFGIRMRHVTFDQWLQNGEPIQTVINNLESANFDPEFFNDYSNEIRKAFKDAFPEITGIEKRSRKKVLGIF